MKLDKQKYTQKNLEEDEEFLAACKIILEDLRSGVWEQVHRTVLQRKDVISKPEYKKDKER